MTTETSTPRTDSQETTGDRMQYYGVVSVVFARQLERELTNARIIGMNEAADIAAQQAADDGNAADSTTDLDSRLNYLAQQERALAIEKAIRAAAMPNSEFRNAASGAPGLDGGVQ